MSPKSEPRGTFHGTHDEHLALIPGARARGELWEGPRLRVPPRTRYSCASPACHLRLDPALVESGFTMHPSCELPELREPIR